MGKPVKNIRSGSIQGTIWENQGQNGMYNTASFKKTYKTENGEWKETQNFQSSDLSDLKIVVSETIRLLKLKVTEIKPNEDGKPSSTF